MTDKKDDDTSVRVALRIRPQNAREKIDMCQVCSSVTPGEPQVFLGQDKAFTFDYVFDTDTIQQTIYDECVAHLIEGCLEGYNATVFAYGQTGSGKTYTMGTGFDMSATPEETGIIPRAVEHLFRGIQARRQQALSSSLPPPDIKVNAQFMELYNEEILDLLDTTRDPETRGKKSHIKIHEDVNGGIYVVGVTTQPVSSLTDTLECLKTGSLSRATASTNMNLCSSRSHAIFTLHIKQHRLVRDPNLEMEVDDSASDMTDSLNEFETLTAKFHFVDLAGSERLKRTGAVGERAKEGISINCGLLALGNVISALGDVTKKGSHVPYRDSKLTRLLQDSLGGNSRTLMIACISPSDRDFMETLNTLKYANRARNIKNKVMANQDKASRQLAQLRGEIAALQQELLDYKTGKRVVGTDGEEGFSDLAQENSLLQQENEKLRTRVKALHETVESLRMHNASLVAEKDAMSKNGFVCNEDVANMIKKYTEETENLRAKLVEAEAQCTLLQKQAARNSMSASMTASMSMTSSSLGMATPDMARSAVLEEAKREMRRLKKSARSQSRRSHHESDKENMSDEEKEKNEVPEKELAAMPEVQNGEEGEGARSDSEKPEEEGMEENEENDESEIEEELSLSDSDSEDKDSDNIHEDLAELTCEISIKQKLISELEATQKQMQAVKRQYEEKVLQLQRRIKETEVERDTILANISQIETMSAEQVKKIKLDYEKKLHDLGIDLKKMQAAKKEHAQLIKNREHYEKQLRTLQHDLGEMKKTKVRLMKQIKEEAERNKQNEAKTSRELAQLRKEQLRKENTIRNLEKQKQQKDMVLRRKQEEVEALRKKQKPLSSKAAGRVGKYEVPPTVPVAPFTTVPKRRRGRSDFSPKVAKQKWDTIEKNISSMVTKKQTIANMEKEMDMWLKNRDRLTKKLEKLIARRKRAIANGEKDIEDLDNAVEMMRGQVNVMQENISDCQAGIMQIEESKEDSQDVDVTEVVNSCSLEEAHYLLEHFLQMAISKGMGMAVKEAENRELVAKLHQTEVNNTLQQDLLRHMMKDHVEVDMEIDNLMTVNDDEDEMESPSSSSSSSPDTAMFDSQVSAAPPTPVSPLALPSGAGDAAARKEKLYQRVVPARRRTATPQELLFSGISADPSPSPLLLPVPETPEEERGGARLPALPAEEERGGGDRDAALMPAPKAPPPPRKTSSLPRMTVTAPSSAGAGPSPSLRRKEYTQPSPDPSPIMRRKTFLPSDRLTRSSSLEMATPPEATPPGSPNAVRRSQRSSDDNVFSRLTNMQSNSPTPNRGRIVPMTRPTSARGVPLACMHTAEGHSKAVLSVCASDQLLFTGSKDRTAKGWDLATGKEIMNFADHPNNVVKVKYVESNHMVFTVSQSFIKVWDIRTKTANCVKTLSSSGLTVDGDLGESKSRQCELSPGEHYIYDIVPSYDGQALYCATGSMVRIWDIRRFHSMGKLSSGTNAPVMVLALDWHNDTNMVIAGSKDHYIKVYEVIVDAAGVISPKYNLTPPHYDGVQSLAVTNRMLFSGSRDMCIKKWDLETQTLKQHVNSAHKDWVCALDFLPGRELLVSGCRAGFLKLWHLEDCSPAGEIRAHSSHINAIATNSTSVFTASNDATVGIWQVRTGSENSDSNSDLGEDRSSVSST